MMKITLLILLSMYTVLKAEPPRFKVRGAPPHRRIAPHQQQFVSKKWHQSHRTPPVRGRPAPSIPVYMPPAHKIPMGMFQGPRPVAPPVRTFWKNTQTANLKFPVLPEKAYQQSPIIDQQFMSVPISNVIAEQNFDPHIQANIIPTSTHIKPIKQVGEKGPIHTIPAPNLSLKDKPKHVGELRPAPNFQQSTSFFQIDQSHQYQVTEQPEPNIHTKMFTGHRPQDQRQFQQQQQLEQQKQRQQYQHQQVHQQQFQLQRHQPQMNNEIRLQPQKMYFSQGNSEPTKNVAYSPSQQEIFLNDNLSPQELYQLLGTAYPQTLVQENASSQQKEQQFEPLQTEDDFDLKASPATHDSPHKTDFQPQYQSFNYDEQAHQAIQKNLANKELSSMVSSGYNLDAGSMIPEKTISSRNSLTQSEIVQSYFDTRSDVERNDVEPDAKSFVDLEDQTEKVPDTIIGSNFFSSLPNKEAAESLAKLQAAGKINSNLMELSDNQNPMTIYIPDNNEEGDEEISQREDDENYPQNMKEQSIEYEEYPQVDNSNNGEKKEIEFGNRIQSKI